MTAYIAPTAQVTDSALVTGQAQVSGQAWVRGWARVVHDVQEVRYWSRRIAEAQATLRALAGRGASS